MSNNIFADETLRYHEGDMESEFKRGRQSGIDSAAFHLLTMAGEVFMAGGNKDAEYLRELAEEIKQKVRP